MATKIKQSNLDNSVITGNTVLDASAASDDVLLVFDTSSGTLKKITASNVGLQAPTISTVSPSNVLNGDGTGNHTFVITGTGYLADATAKIVTNGGTDITFDTVTRNSATQLTGVVAKSKANLTNANEPFDITVTVLGALSATKADAFTIDASPVYVTSAGTLGTIAGGSAMSTIDIVATDPESAGNVTFELQSGTLPAGVSSATVHENGVSKFRITGTPTNLPAASTTSNFVLRAVDAASNTTSRAFSITVNRTYARTSFTSSGTFAVPSGATAVNVLVVGAGGGSQSQPGPTPAHRAGSGGGGAGGLIYMPGVPVTADGTIAITVGSGTPGAGDGEDSVFGASPSPGTTEVLTAKGGGRGGSAYQPGSAASIYLGYDGGSGGGSNSSTLSTGTQPTQPGNSGAYGFGNPGGPGNYENGGGGGGAGAAGSSHVTGNGGAGKAYTIADGTTSVYYAGGGGGGGSSTGTGGQGGGGAGTMVAGQANKGGGAGGSSAFSQPNVGGGKGIVIVEY